MRKLFRTRVAAACAVLLALLGLPAAPADALTMFAGTCAVNARLDGNILIVDGSCVYVPTVSGTIAFDGGLQPVLPLGVCSTGIYQTSVEVDTTADETGQLQAVNTGSLELFFISNNQKMIFLGELLPTAVSGVCPNRWSGVLVIEDPSLD